MNATKDYSIMVYPSSTIRSDRDSGLGDLEAQLAIKEREWKELQAARVQLESSLKKTQEECSSLRECYQQLREDFQFNLVILDERDRELERYDVTTAKALTLEHNRQEELNQLHIQVTKLEEQRARETEEMQEELKKTQHNTSQHRLRLDKLKHYMAGEIQKQTEEYERMKWNLQCRIQKVEGELTLQKQVKQLSKETVHKVHFQAQLQSTEVLQASTEFCQQIQTQLQHKHQEIKDLTAVKDYRIKELEDKLKWVETKLKMEEDDHIKKYEDVVRTLKWYDAQLETQCQAHTEQLQKAEKNIVKLQETVEVLTAQARCIQEVQQEAMEQKDETIQSLRKEVQTTRTGWDKYISEVSSKMVVKDTEMISLQERETKLRTEQERSRKEMEGYKQQLSAGLKRELALEQMLVQVELEWQRHCEDMKAEQYLANEQLIQDLTQAREQAKAELKEKEQELHDFTVFLHSVKMERDQAIQGLTPKVDCLASEEIRHLQEQNSILRAMVTKMRKDMESLSLLLPHPQAQSQAFSPKPDEHLGAPATTSISPTANTQMAAGGLCLNKHANTSPLTNQEVRVSHKKSALANNMEQSALVQQQASGLRSGDLFEIVQGAKSNLPNLHTRLKQAALCIARLSREKQQLIEMGNRLRAQITTAGRQETVEPERDSSTEKQGDQHDMLSALEQLQYQLTTQELKYALRQRACTQLLPGTKNRGPASKGAANPWSQNSKNKESPPQSSLGVRPQPHSCLSRTWLSSEESLRSLTELWDLLDHGLSPSIFSEGEGELSKRKVAESGCAGVQMMVHGISAPIHSQRLPDVQQRKNLSTTPSKTSRPGTPGRISKIRNYNIKD